METAGLRCHIFEASGRTVEVFPSECPDRPVIYLHTVSKEGIQVYQALREMNCPDFSLVAISGLRWNHDMTPWDIPPISKNDAPCTGGADKYLYLLTNEVVPQAEELIQSPPAWRGLSGYSLAGLFAVYAMYHTSLFSRIASMSGSLWFPGFKEYAMSREPGKKPEHLYISLGDKECKTRNPYLKTVQANTEELAAFYQSQQIDTEFQLHPGGHFADVIKRSALGIRWLLSR